MTDTRTTTVLFAIVLVTLVVGIIAVYNAYRINKKRRDAEHHQGELHLG